jgi:long-subunit acyl-CoA synthetase (AMP-forming)
MASTVMDLMERTAARHADLPAMKARRGDGWKTWTWRDYRDEVRRTARAFIALGLEPGGAISILGSNRPEWLLSNLAAIYAGGVPTGLYLTSSAPQCQYIARHNASALAVVEDAEALAKISEVWHALPDLEAVVMMNGSDPDERVHSWQDLAGLAESVPEQELERRIAMQRPEELCTLIYTSGTTGHPKGVMLSHDNLTWTATQAVEAIRITERDQLISYLPLSHIAEQLVSVHAPLVSGACTWFAENIERLGDDLREVRPTLFLGVPRVWEKIQSKVVAAAAGTRGLKRRVALWAKAQGLAGGYAEQEGRPKPLAYSVAKALVFNKVREKLGLDRSRLVATTAAPIALDTLEFFLSLGIPIYEMYGMSECTGPTTISLPGRHRLGAAGPALTGTEIRIGDLGEICVRGRHVFLGYYKDPEATANAIDADGWLHTGDVGTLDAQGLLTITDRLKELIITAGGENIAPQMIEGELKAIRVVSQAVVVGDRRKHLTALLTLNADHLAAELETAGSPAKDPAQAALCPIFNAYLQRQVDGVNQKLSRFQSIKKFTIVPRDFSVEGGELTHTMKLKRRVIHEKYAAQIEAMYS